MSGLSKPARPARLSGQWYPSRSQEIDAFLPPAPAAENAVAAICPHAGWIYSGSVAGTVYARLPPADSFILVGVNHFMRGHPLSLYSPGSWETPAGELEIDTELAENILKMCGYVTVDFAAHEMEHSLEVQTPFIARRFPRSRIVPLLMFDYSPPVCRALSDTLVRIMSAASRRIFLIASTDLSHVGPDYRQIPPKGFTADSFARAQDEIVLKRILSLDGEGLLETAEKRSVSMCGAGPAAVAVLTANRLRAGRAEKIAYATSSDVSGDKNTTVGYAGVLFSR